jgi:AraC-like DNA-binding protein
LTERAVHLAAPVSAVLPGLAGGSAVGTVAWLDISSHSGDEWPMTVKTGPLGLQIMPLANVGNAFSFRSGRLRGMRSVLTASTVVGCELRRSARPHADASDNTAQVLIRNSSPGDVFASDTDFAGAMLRVITGTHEVCEDFPVNSHVVTLNVQQAALGIEHDVVAALAEQTFVVTPMQSALIKAVICFLTDADPADLHKNVQAVDRYIAAATALLLRTLVPMQKDEPERLGSVRARTEALIHAQAADPELTPASLAAQLCVSLRQLYRAFDGTESPAARIRHRRLELAAEILAAPGTPPSVDKIAAQCGFVSAEYFSRAFRRQYGLSPRAYRTAHKDPARSR